MRRSVGSEFLEQREWEATVVLLLSILLSSAASGAVVLNSSEYVGFNVSEQAVGQVNSTGLDLQDNHLYQFFQNDCPTGQVVREIGADGGFSCIDADEDQNLSEVLAIGNVANTSIDMAGNDINNVGMGVFERFQIADSDWAEFQINSTDTVDQWAVTQENSNEFHIRAHEAGVSDWNALTADMDGNISVPNGLFRVGGGTDEGRSYVSDSAWLGVVDNDWAGMEIGGENNHSWVHRLGGDPSTISLEHWDGNSDTYNVTGMVTDISGDITFPDGDVDVTGGGVRVSTSTTADFNDAMFVSNRSSTDVESGLRLMTDGSDRWFIYQDNDGTEDLQVWSDTHGDVQRWNHTTGEVEFPAGDVDVQSGEIRTQGGTNAQLRTEMNGGSYAYWYFQDDNFDNAQIGYDPRGANGENLFYVWNDEGNTGGITGYALEVRDTGDVRVPQGELDVNNDLVTGAYQNPAYTGGTSDSVIGWFGDELAFADERYTVTGGPGSLSNLFDGSISGGADFNPGENVTIEFDGTRYYIHAVGFASEWSGSRAVNYSIEYRNTTGHWNTIVNATDGDASPVVEHDGSGMDALRYNFRGGAGTGDTSHIAELYAWDNKADRPLGPALSAGGDTMYGTLDMNGNNIQDPGAIYMNGNHVLEVDDLNFNGGGNEFSNIAIPQQENGQLAVNFGKWGQHSIMEWHRDNTTSVYGPLDMRDNTIEYSSGGIQIGDSSTSTSSGDGVAVGNGASTGTGQAVAMGWSANASGNDAVAIGDTADASNESDVAVGEDAVASGQKSVALGYATNASNYESVAIGDDSVASGYESIALGIDGTTAGGDRSIALSQAATAAGLEATATGHNANASGERATAVGEDTVASGQGTVAVGENAEATDDHAAAFGLGARATGHGAFAIGEDVTAAGDQSLALGHNTIAADDYEAVFGAFGGDEMDINVTGSTTVYDGLDMQNSNITNCDTIAGVSCTSTTESQTQTTATRAEWKAGTFHGTSPDRDNRSGSLGIGYLDDESNLKGAWRLDRSPGQGENVKDYSEYGNDGDRGSQVDPDQTGVFGTDAFNFTYDGENMGPTVNISYDSSMDPDELTISAWYYSYGHTSDFQTFLGHDYSSSFWFGIDDSNDEYFYQLNDVCSSANGGTTEYGQWTHAVLTYESSSGNASVWENGELEFSNDCGSGNLNQHVDPFGIGNNPHNPSNPNPMNGFLDEVRIYDRPLDPDEIRELYFQGRDGTFEGNYSRTIDNDGSTSWNSVDVNTTIPANTDVDLVFQAMDDAGSVVEEQVIDLSDGDNSYTLNVQDSEDAKWILNGTSTDVTATWEVHSVDIHYDTTVPADIAPQSLGQVLQEGSTASTDINMNGNDIDNVGTLNAETKNFVHDVNKTHRVVYTASESGNAVVEWEGTTEATPDGIRVTYPQHFQQVLAADEDIHITATPVNSLARVGVFDKNATGFTLKASEVTTADFHVRGIRDGYADKKVVRSRQE